MIKKTANAHSLTMPSKYAALPEYSLLYKRVWGRYTEADNAASHRERHRLSQSTDIGDFSEIQDLRDVTEYAISVEKMQSLARQYRRLTEEEQRSGKYVARSVAYVAPSPVVFGTARVYEAITASTALNFRAFREIEDALGWLGMSAEVIDVIDDIRRRQEDDGLID